jgi:sugar lactone lactonase YvrE
MNRLASSFVSFIAAILLVSGTASAQIALPSAGVIGTIAGNGIEGFAGDGGLAISAELNGINGVAVDVSGNVYLLDFANARVRKVAASTGILTTVVGNGTAGFSGDGGAATSAQINQATGIAVDGSGNLYIADSLNNRVRMVTASTGIITTVAGNGTAGFAGDGGAATGAELNQPAAIAVDAVGNIFVVDGQTRVREVVASTGVIETIAGDGTAGFAGDGGQATSAELNQPSGLAVDWEDNVYIADTRNNRVRIVTAATGVIATLAGSGMAGFSGDGGAALTAELSGVSGVALDAAGNLYVSDAGNARVREVVAATGLIATVAGDGTAGFSGDGGLATGAELALPQGVAVDPAGNLYVADATESRVRVVGTVATAAAPGYTVTVTSSDMSPTVGELVTLTATVVNSANQPVTGGTVTWVNGISSIGSSVVNGSGVATLVTTLGQTATQVITASYTASGTDTTTQGTLALSVVGFSVAGADASTVTVSAGQLAQVTLAVAGFNGFSGTVALSCSGVPAPGSCAVSSDSVSFTGGASSQDVTLSVQTSAATTSAMRREGGAFGSLARGIAMAMMCPVFVLGFRSRRSRRVWMVALLFGVSVAMGMGLTGCSGGTSKSGASSGLASGSYTVLVTATSGTISLTLPIVVTVQ